MKTSLVVLLAMLALAGVSARDLQQDFSSGGKCVAVGSSAIQASSENAFADACAKAIVRGCSADLTVKRLVVDSVKFYEVAAEAIVKVWTAAFAKCSTYGNAFGCASAHAFASKEVQAYITLYASAIAKAKNNCYDCDPKAAAEIFASLFVDLYAFAQAESKAKVCVGPNQTASAFAFSKCNAQVLAHGFAYAHAKAVIKGGCTKLDAKAVAEVDTYVHADPYCKCKGWAIACNNGRCTWTYDKGAYINGAVAKRYPAAWAFFKAECDAFAVQV